MFAFRSGRDAAEFRFARRENGLWAPRRAGPVFTFVPVRSVLRRDSATEQRRCRPAEIRENDHPVSVHPNHALSRAKEAVMKKLLLSMVAVSIVAFSAAVAAAFTNVCPEELKSCLADPKEAANMVLVDVRTEPEFKDGHLGSAVNIPFAFERVPGDKTTRYPNPDFKTQILKFAKDNAGKKVYLVCATSHRTEQAANMLAADPAFAEVSIVNVFGGMKGRPGVTGVKDLVALVK
jgi:rhodanese-related sulfurtransferase